MSKRLPLLASFILIFALPAVASAKQASVWRHTGIERFAEGDLDKVSITTQGQLRLAPEVRELARPDCLFIWSVVEDSLGNIFFGTDDKGSVMKLDGEGRLTRYLQTDEVNIYALAVDSKDNLYAGASPNGLIYRVTPDGRSSLFYRSESDYIWSLAVDGDDHLIVAAGREGAVLRISPGGQAETLFETNDTHVYSLLVHPERGIFAGTSPSGLVYHRTPGGDLKILLDAPEPDIRTLAIDQEGRLFVGTASDLAGNQRGPTGLSGADDPAHRFDQREPGENSLYLIDLESGRVLRGLGVGNISFFSSFWSDENLYIGTGDHGFLLKVSQEIGLELALARQEKQLLSMTRARDGRILIGTGNPAALISVSDTFSRKGVYKSQVLDSHFGGEWGRADWFGEVDEENGSVSVSTRSGNTVKPDETWNAWKPLRDEEGMLRIDSEPARFLQYRIEMKTELIRKSPFVERVSIFYRQRNMPPRITEMEAKYEEASSGNGEDAHKRASVLDISWKAEDPNEDALRFLLLYRKEGQEDWRLISDDAKQSPYKWETMYVPDGIYRILLVATDEPSNTADDALMSEELSEPVVVDNSRPRVEDLTARGTPRLTVEVSGTAVNDVSNIARIEYSLRGGEWKNVMPSDGIADSPREKFSFETERIGLTGVGSQTVTVRVTDERGNVGVGQVTLGGSRN